MFVVLCDLVWILLICIAFVLVNLENTSHVKAHINNVISQFYLSEANSVPG